MCFSVILTLIVVVCLLPELHSNCLLCVMTQIANLCKLCTKKVQSFSHYLQCANSLWKCHVRCMDMKVSDITYPDQWYCPRCMENRLVYNHYDDNDSFHNAVIGGMLDWSFHHHEMNNKVFTPDEINDRSDTPFSEIDPDFQFCTDNYYITNSQCDYYKEEAFVNKFTQSWSFDRNLSIFHLNIQSLPKHCDELEMYLDSLKFPFSFIDLTETWFDECNENLWHTKIRFKIQKNTKGWRSLITCPQSYIICVKKWPCLFWLWNRVDI